MYPAQCVTCAALLIRGVRQLALTISGRADPLQVMLLDADFIPSLSMRGVARDGVSWLRRSQVITSVFGWLFLRKSPPTLLLGQLTSYLAT